MPLLRRAASPAETTGPGNHESKGTIDAISSYLVERLGVRGLLGAVSGLPARGADPGVLRVGTGLVDVTPRRWPVSMLGSFNDRQATSAHDPLLVRAVVLDDGRTRLAIATCDTCVITAGPVRPGQGVGRPAHGDSGRPHVDGGHAHAHRADRDRSEPASPAIRST